MLRISPNPGRKSYCSDDWIMKDDRSDGTLEDDDDDNLLVIANGHPLPPSSSPDLIRDEIDGPIHSMSRRHSDVLGIPRTRSFDANLIDIRQVSADKIAEQLTLIDLALLKSISIEEFHGCKFEKKEKLTTSPNIANFTRRFNHTSFWVVRDILNETSTKSRAEIVAQFIRIARHLQELNDIHSLVSMVLAIQSYPIARLSQTWKFVPKREKLLFEKLTEFISEENNYFNLREHMSKIATPCIPHLGLHQKDLIFLDTVTKRVGATEQDKLQCKQKVDKIYELILNCQRSRYDALMPVKHIQKYLKSLRYIDEFQKFYEDDNYKLSLEREPNRKGSTMSTSSSRPLPCSIHPIRNSKSQEDLLGAPLKPEITGLFTPPRQLTASRFSDSNFEKRQPNPLTLPSVQVTQVVIGNSIHSTPVKPKLRTLPANMRELSIRDLAREGSKSAEPCHNNNNNDNDSSSNIIMKNTTITSSPSLVHRKHRGHSKSQSLGTNVLTVLGITSSRSQGVNGSGSSPELPPHPISLLDDSLLDNTLISTASTVPVTTSGSNEYFTPPISTASSSSPDAHSFDEESEVFLQDSLNECNEMDLKDGDVIRQGILKRRVLFKNGHSTQLKLSHKYWVKLTEKSIVFVPGKYKDSSKKPKRLKFISLISCRVKYEDPSIHLKTSQFLIVDERGNQTRFTASSSHDAYVWVTDIRASINHALLMKRKQEQDKPLIRL